MTAACDAAEDARADEPLFARVLGGAFADLPPRVRALHARPGTHRYRGIAHVVRGTSFLSRLCGWAARLPPAGEDVAVEVRIDAASGRERWTRRFGGHAMTSDLQADGIVLRERLGLVTFGFLLSVTDTGLLWNVCEVRALGVPLPVRGFAGVIARESEHGGRYRFAVAAALPFAGEIVRYEGWLDDGET